MKLKIRKNLNSKKKFNTPEKIVKNIQNKLKIWKLQKNW